MKEEIPKYKLSKILVLLYLLFNVYKRMNIISKHNINEVFKKYTSNVQELDLTTMMNLNSLAFLSKFTNSAAFTNRFIPCMPCLIMMAYRFILL